MKEKKILAFERPDLLKEWDFERNDLICAPDEISIGSHFEVWWKCSNNHVWKAEVRRRVKGALCPYCSNKRVLSGFNDFTTKHPELVKEWDYEKNGTVKPEYVNYGSARKYWWKCSICGNEWSMTPNARTNQNQGCPICSLTKRGRKRMQTIISKDGSLATNRPDLLNEWDYEKNDIPPDMISTGSKKKVWWKCSKCHGSWKTTIDSRSKKDGTNCPYCSGRKVLTGVNDFSTIHPELLQEWIVEKNNGLKPTDFYCHSNIKILWTCTKCGNEWTASIDSRSKGSGCPVCTKIRLSQNKSKRVICKETETVFSSVTEASKWAGISAGTLVGCLKGHRKSAGGYHWEYYDK